MKLSVKLEDDQNYRHQQQHQNIKPPIVTAKIPISIFNNPFLTSISSTITDSSHLSLSLSSNFSSGPSLKLSYSPTITSSSSSPSSSPPFSLSLKSGLGLFGSPNHSPLIFTAHFSFSSPNPTFSLHVKPQFGNFSLKKTTFSNPRKNGGFVSDHGSRSGIEANSDSGSASNREKNNGFVVPEGSSVWQELKLEPFGVEKDGEYKESFGSEKDGFLSGIAVMARTVFPVTKRVKMNMRWGVNLPSDLGSKMPYLKLNKIGVERVEEATKEEEEKKNKRKSDERSGDLELLKGMCFWMRRDLEVLEMENREMKESLEQIKFGVSGSRSGSVVGAVASKVPSAETSSEFETWRNRKNVKEENGKREPKKPSTNQANDLESELERAIKAAAAST